MFRDYSKDPTLTIFYNVSMTVGKKSDPNRRDDVLLVQFFLREVYKQPLNLDPPMFPPGGMFHPDGYRQYGDWRIGECWFRKPNECNRYRVESNGLTKQLSCPGQHQRCQWCNRKYQRWYRYLRPESEARCARGGSVFIAQPN